MPTIKAAYHHSLRGIQAERLHAPRAEALVESPGLNTDPQAYLERGRDLNPHQNSVGTTVDENGSISFCEVLYTAAVVVSAGIAHRAAHGGGGGVEHIAFA